MSFLSFSGVIKNYKIILNISLFLKDSEYYSKFLFLVQRYIENGLLVEKLTIPEQVIADEINIIFDRIIIY